MDEELFKKHDFVFKTNQNHPVLIGFPFCGLEIVARALEIYLQTTGLPHSFFAQSHKEIFWGKFTNDLRGEYTKRPNVFYLYNDDPIFVIYNVLEKENREHTEHNIRLISSLYRDHKTKFNTSKYIFSYQQFTEDVYGSVVKLGTELENCLFPPDEKKWWTHADDTKDLNKFAKSREDFFNIHMDIENALKYYNEDLKVPEAFVEKYRRIMSPQSIDSDTPAV
jgi:hypothetical protein